MPLNLREKTALESIPMTPLIDVVFLLLVFFLVATSLSEEERQMDVMLPEASEAQPLIARPHEVIVNVNASGEYFIGGERLSLDQLRAAMRRAAAASRESRQRASVILRADQRCRWKSVVAAMDACNKAKIKDYKVTVLPETG